MSATTDDLRAAGISPEIHAQVSELSDLLKRVPIPPRRIRRAFGNFRVMFRYSRQDAAFTVYLFELGVYGTDPNMESAIRKAFQMLCSQLDFVIAEGNWDSWPAAPGAWTYLTYARYKVGVALITSLVHGSKIVPQVAEIEELHTSKEEVRQVTRLVPC